MRILLMAKVNIDDVCLKCCKKQMKFVPRPSKRGDFKLICAECKYEMVVEIEEDIKGKLQKFGNAQIKQIMIQ